MGVIYASLFLSITHSIVTLLVVIKRESLSEISIAGNFRSNTLRDLVSPCPSQTSYIKLLAYTHQKLHTLIIFIALDKEYEQRNSKAVGGAKEDGVMLLANNIVIH